MVKPDGSCNGSSNNQVRPSASDHVLRESVRRPCLSILPFSAAFSLFTNFAYIRQRVEQARVGGASSTIWMALIVEILASVPAIFTQIGVLIAGIQAEGDRLPQSLGDGERPRVDVFITHCGEGEEIVLNTARAACTLDWPSKLLRIVVLDDSSSVELAEKVRLLNKEVLPELSYASRGLQVKTYSKAANLNFGLKLVENLEQGKAEFVAVLDVDMIPEPDWICRVLPHVLHNSKAGLACPPQRYYNIPRGDPLGVLTDDLPGECIIHLQDFSNSTFCTGSGFVARRSALDSIGGVPEETLQEDDLTSYKLLAAGWHSVYVSGSFQWGLGPDTFAGYLKQSKRWAVGIISVNCLMWTDWAKKLPLQNRLIFVLWGVVIGSTALIWTFVFVALPYLATSGQALIPMQNTKDVRFLMRLASINFGAQSVYQICLSSFVDFRMPFHTLFGAVWTQPWKLMMILRYFLIPRLFKYDLPNFTPTGMAVDGENERKARARRSRLAMLKVVFWDCSAYLHLFILLCCIIGAVKWSQVIFHSYSVDGIHRAGITSLTGITWPPIFLLWAALAQCAWLPLAYVLSPIPLPKKDDLLVRNVSNGVKYPSRRAQADFMRRPTQWPFLLKCLVYLSALLLCELLRDTSVE